MAKKLPIHINLKTGRRPATKASRAKASHAGSGSSQPRPRPRRQRPKIRYLAVALAVLSLSLPGQLVASTVQAESCPDVKFLFVRGSGSERYHDKNYESFKSTLESKLATTSLNYAFDDLDYPATNVGLDNLLVTLGAFVGGGESYTFGASINTGVENLAAQVNSTTCPNTQYVVAGYSQGAIVVSKALSQLNPDKLLYAATFGDPKLYLPEGQGLFPDACRNQNLSDYRTYVPDCYAYQGLLGGFIPYRPDALTGKVGVWCNKHDFFCSPYLDMTQHTSYVADDLYEDASRVIFDYVVRHFQIESHVSSVHDTAIVIDSTSSMSSLIGQYKAEALRLARETLESGGRVALYDYRDLDDPYEPHQHCDFESCDLDTFERELNSITVGGGGDTEESLLSASLHVMKELELQWQRGATKSLVVLTDAGYLITDRDGTTLDDVVALSKSIDPVNFYVITKPDLADVYAELTSRTDGKVVTNMDELSLLTDYIMDRYDSLPRVEESDVQLTLPTLTIDSVERLGDGTSARVRYTTDAPKALVILNDTILGTTDQTELTISELRPEFANTITLVPITDEVRGAPDSASINDGALIVDTPAVPDSDSDPDPTPEASPEPRPDPTPEPHFDLDFGLGSATHPNLTPDPTPEAGLDSGLGLSFSPDPTPDPRPAAPVPSVPKAPNTGRPAAS